jgi:hypothetical protein
MEIETKRSLLFLDVFETRRPDCSLRYSVHRKTIHADLYLHAKSHHHPQQKYAVTVPRQCLTQCLNAEIRHLRKTSRRKWVLRRMNKKGKRTTEKWSPILVVS